MSRRARCISLRWSSVSDCLSAFFRKAAMEFSAFDGEEEPGEEPPCLQAVLTETTNNNVATLRNRMPNLNTAAQGSSTALGPEVLAKDVQGYSEIRVRPDRLSKPESKLSIRLTPFRSITAT